jgi:hypothetical protein
MEASFGKIQLPGFILADLYKDNLVLYDDVVQVQNKETIIAAQPIIDPIIEKPSSPIKTSITAENTVYKKWFLGDNNKHIAILVKDEESVFLRDEWLQFLSTILGACKLNIGDVAIVNCANYNTSYSQLNESISPQYFLLFDVSAKDIQLPFTVPDYQLQKFGNAQFLMAPSLSQMLGNSETVKVAKTKLWMSLKQMFGI